MTVQNYLSTTANPFTHPQTAEQVTGQRTKKIRTLVSVANGDGIGSIYFLGMVPDEAVVNKITLEGGTIAGLTDCDIGLFDKNGNAKVTGTGMADFYADGLNLSAAPSGTGDFGQGLWNGMSNRAVSTACDRVWQNAGDVEGPFPASGSTIKSSKYQIGLTINAAASAAGTLVATIEYQCAE